MNFLYSTCRWTHRKVKEGLTASVVANKSYVFEKSLIARAFSYSSLQQTKKPVLLCILDGWGYNPSSSFNSVLMAKTPVFDSLWSHCSQRGCLSFLDACEESVGLPKGQIGNSEVGHMNIGAGRVVYQDICRIDNAIEDKSIEQSERLLSFVNKLKDSKGKCHLMALVSPGGVHSHQTHVSFLANFISKQGVEVVIHAFTDGRDVPPQEAKDTFPEFLASLNSDQDGTECGSVSVGTVIGRYYGMDRDTRWERVEKAYQAICSGVVEKEEHRHATPIDAIESSYQEGVTDEFVLPRVISSYEGMSEGDGLLMANFRADRARQILQVFLTDQTPISKNSQPKLSDALGLVSYSNELSEFMGVIMEDKQLTKTIGEVVSANGLSQLRIAETEKYPHVTFFLNGGREQPFEREERILVPSPKVATYDLQPEMSVYEVGDKLCESILSKDGFDMIICNFANPDMVGHTGKIEASTKAVQSVDEVLGKVKQCIDEVGGAMIVTADHGNCEQMWNFEIDEPHTAHTLNKVPCMLYVGGSSETLEGNAVSGDEGSPSAMKLGDGALCDLAPTILELLNVSQPTEMTGQSLISRTNK